jgi:pyrophosphate--fructose-6-phosphate 1-phosphotransferase
MNQLSSLQKIRTEFQPKLPFLFDSLEDVIFSTESVAPISEELILSSFPSLSSLPVLHAKKGKAKPSKALRIGVVFSGGQAPGGHNVIAGTFDGIKKIDCQSELIGFIDGPIGVIKGNYKALTEKEIAPFRNLGGFDLLGSGRDKIETDEQLVSSLHTVESLKLDALVIVGGDDSNTNAAVLAQYFIANKCSCSVIGVPKTIDGDLQNEYVPISFGFDSACKVYSELIGNIAKDALSSKKYYHFIKLMGRSASHITLECALSTRVNISLIAEEIADKKMTLLNIVDMLSDLITQRAQQGKNYGVILIPEGLIEFIPEVSGLIKELNSLLSREKDLAKGDISELMTPQSKQCFLSLPQTIQQQLLLDRDPHGNVQLSHIETEKLLSQMVAQRLTILKSKGSYVGKFSPVHHYLGYEGRSGMPTNFDAHYCYALGYLAALLAKDKASGYMCFISNLHAPVSQWEGGGVPLASLMHPEMRKGKLKPVIKKSLVNLSGPSFEKFTSQRKDWALQDHYLCPGPTQYFGPEEVSFQAPTILKY